MPLFAKKTNPEPVVPPAVSSETLQPVAEPKDGVEAISKKEKTFLKSQTKTSWKDKKERSDKAKAQASVEAQLDATRAAFQDLVPIKDIIDQCFVDERQFYFPLIRISPINYDLISADERIAFAAGLTRFLSSLNIPSYQFSILPMPYDITDWEKHNREIMDEIDKEINTVTSSGSSETQNKISQLQQRKNFLDTCNRSISGKIRTGSFSTQKAYLIPFFNTVQKGQQKPYYAVLEKARELIVSFRSAGFDAVLCTEAEMRSFLKVLMAPTTKNVANLPRNDLPPVLTAKKED